MVKIKVDKLSKSFGDQELFKDVSFEVFDGEVIGIVGKNGSGKTTLANIIYGIEDCDSGNIQFFYNHVNIGYLKQTTEYDEEKVADVITSSTDYGHLFKVNSELGLQELSKRENIKANTISGGEKSKLILSTIWSGSH